MILTRPLISLDVETDGKGNPEEQRIVELGFKQLYPDGRPPKTWVGLINPGRPISAGAQAVHRISDEDVQYRPQFKDFAKNLAIGFRDCDYCGYSVKFDLRVLDAEMKRAGVQWSYEGAFILDALRMWQIIAPRTLADAVREHLKREPTHAHRALGDAEDALDVAMELTTKFQVLRDKTVEELHALLWPRDSSWIDNTGKIIWRGEEACLNFGVHRDKPLRRVPPKYLEWMLSSNFDQSTQKIIIAALAGQYPVK